MSSLLFGLASDLHMDFRGMNQEFFEWRGDALLLAGDLAEEDKLRKMDDFWSRVADMAEQVYVVAGNHEHYGSEIDETHDHLRNYLARFSHVHLMENDVRFLHGVAIFGATMWTDFEGGNPMRILEATDAMNDYRKIRIKKSGYTKLRPLHTMAKHQATLTALDEVVKSHPETPMVVMTHHAPSYRSVPERFKSYTLNAAYASRLDDFIEDRPQIKVWVHGHIHTRADYMIGDNCRVMVHARGYPGENFLMGDYDPYTVKEFRVET